MRVMSFYRAGLAVTALALLSACVPESPAVTLPAPLPDGASCGADGLQGLVGQRESVLATMTLPQQTRILRPNTAVTMDFRPDRLNIDVDASGRITRVHCV